MEGSVFERLVQLEPKFPPFLSSQLIRLFWNAYWRYFHLRSLWRFRRWMPEFRYGERATLIEAICRRFPFGNLLEVGFGIGQNLQHLLRLVPSVEFSAVEKDRELVTLFGEFLKTQGHDQVELHWESADDLSLFEDSSFDVVVCGATLLYVGPDKIIETLSEMLRVCRGSLILLEQQLENPLSSSVQEGIFVPRTDGRGAGYWLRDYVTLLERLAPDRIVSAQKIVSPVWTTEKWQEYGTLIEVDRTT